MDVFKIHVGEGRAIAISRENYFMETKGMEPYVVERDGHRTFYAVCPECDNPIQLIGLNRRELDAGHRRPYGKHVGHDVTGVAVYDETAYLECSYSNPGYHRDPGSRRPPSNPTALALYRIMRDRFDRVEYAWRRASGIRLGIKRLRRALTLWRNDKAWLNYDSTYCNLPQMLFMGSPEQDLYGQCVSKDGPVAAALSTLDDIRLEPVDFSEEYVRVSTTRFTNVTFTLGPPSKRKDGEHMVEYFPLCLLHEGRQIGGFIQVRTDPEWFSRILNMPDWHENHRLSAMAADVLG